MGDAQLTRIGTDVKGRAAYLHPVAARAWAAASAYILAILGIDLRARIIQAYGQAAASAGTHGSPPCAVDIRVWGLTRGQIEAVVRLLRECGWIATWYRDWAGNLHIHAVCDIGTWSPARYQCTAVKAGYDGLGAGGRKGRDTHPKPSTWRTAAQGAAWAEAQIAPPPRTDLERLLDTMDTKDLTKIINDALNSNPTIKLVASRAGEAEGAAKLAVAQTGPIRRGGQDISLRQEVADAKTSGLAIQGQMAGLTAAITQLAKGQPLDLAAIEAAAKRGVEEGLAGARVTVELG